MNSNKRNLKENKEGNQGQGQIRKEVVEAATGGILWKGYSNKHCKVHWKTPVNFVNSANFAKF